ncbi:hypothetical protein EVA_17918 [gut metagenome]|uniref:Uncharacterized protein n=1 Tax=gut metagenome TaxID=749906 RepID=J9FGD0_9ZZZZ
MSSLFELTNLTKVLVISPYNQHLFEELLDLRVLRKGEIG